MDLVGAHHNVIGSFREMTQGHEQISDDARDEFEEPIEFALEFNRRLDLDIYAQEDSHIICGDWV